MNKSDQKKQHRKQLKNYQLYEYLKQEIARTSKSCQEYETRIYNLCKKYGF